MKNEQRFIHESAYVDQLATVGSGTKIWHFSHVMKNCSIGKDCNIGQNVFISSGVIIGNGVKIQNNVSVYTGVTCEDFVFLGPSCVFTNVINPRSFIEKKDEYKTTRVGVGASIGANSTIVCGNNIGKYALVGAGAVVTCDVPDYGLVIGNPARLVGYVCTCGERLRFNDEKFTQCNVCGRGFVISNGVVKEMKG